MKERMKNTREARGRGRHWSGEAGEREAREGASVKFTSQTLLPTRGREQDRSAHFAMPC